MTVTRLEAEMPNLEYVKWGVVLGRRAQREQLTAKKGKK